MPAGSSPCRLLVSVRTAELVSGPERRLRGCCQSHKLPVEAGRKLEVVGGEKVGIGKNLGAGAVRCDLPAGEDDGPLAELGGKREVVGDDQHRAFDPSEDVKKLAPAARVEVRGGLVEDEQLRPHGEDGGDSYAAALAHRELVWGPVGRVFHSDGLKRILDTSRNDFLRFAHVERPESDVFPDCRHEELVVGILEDEPDTWAQSAQRAVVDLQACDLEAALASEEAVQVVNECRLPGAVRAKHGDALAVVDCEGHTPQRLAPVGVAVAHVASVDQTGHGMVTRRSGNRQAAIAATNAASTTRKRSVSSAGIDPR